MVKMRLVYFFYSVLILCFIPNCSSQESSCLKVKQINGTISESSFVYSASKCWIIKVPEDSFVRIDFKSLSFGTRDCYYNYLKIFVAGMTENYTFCGEDAYPKPITAFNDVTIRYYFSAVGHYGRASFTLHYATGDFNATLAHAINWLKQRQTNFGWGRNTHRAITALYLTNAAQFQGNKMEEEVMVKHLRIRLAVALSRNTTYPMSVNELSMYVNALTVTCHSHRNFLSKDLLKVLAGRTFSASSPSPGAYLTLCNAKWPFTSSNVDTLLKLLKKDTGHQFRPEIQAMTILALSCIKERTDLFNEDNDTYIFNSTIANLMTNQREDGSFGNPHTTAIVAQALIASGVKYNRRRNVTRALYFLMNHLNSSSVDFLSVYFTLPLLAGKTLADIGQVHCKGNHRRVDEDDSFVDATIDEFGYSHIQFSLYFGDRKEIVHTVYLSVPYNSTAYDVMKMAAVGDPYYKFSYHIENDHMYVYMIAGLANDIESGEYWHFYSQSPHEKELKHHTSSPDQITVGKNEHLIMWYKTAHI